jgi:serine phosphatase RsbU (regulator of sigma subunit)
MRAIEVPARPAVHQIGRHEQCDLRLPPEVETVSRVHARLSHEAGQWRLADLNSRWGTFLNGVRLGSGQELPLVDGDLIRINPWTFHFSLSGPARRALRSVDDLAESQTLVRSFGPEAENPLANDLLALLLEMAAGMHAAQDSAELAKLILDGGVRGTGLANAALIRPLDGEGRLEILAARWATAEGPQGAQFSRSLLAAAANGSVAELSAANDAPVSQSIAALHIRAALCVPILLNNTVSAYLYLDAREGAGNQDGGLRQALRPNAAAFCLALGRMASLAMSNLKRLEIERRQALFEADLAAAAAAQKWILPQRQGSHGPFCYIGESRAGQFVGGDFFDVVALDAHRVALALGDVSGKGISASVLMTASQGFLHAALLEHASAAKAVTDLNRYVAPRRPTAKFVTLWVGIFDLQAGTLSYVDAGHGYALLMAGDGTIQPLSAGGGLPVGVDEMAVYTAEVLALPPAGRAVVVSDGIVEQFGPAAGGAGSAASAGGRHQFAWQGVQRSLLGSVESPDPVAALFDAVVAHARSTALSDDATAVWLKW